MARGEIHAPERQVLAIGDGNVLLSMPAIGADIGVIKLITVHGDNAQHGLALPDSPTLTARRTAAVSLLGIRALAAAPPASALLIGSGAQAAAHADALIDFFGVSR